MSLADQADKYQLLDEWFKSPQGLRVANAFAFELSNFQKHIYGKSLLQLGSFGSNTWLKSLHFIHKWCATPYFDIEKSSLSVSINELSIDRNSVDCVVAPFSVELFKKEQSPIVEIDRILKPMGHVILFGINPWSFWGVAIRWGNPSCFGQVTENLASSFKVKSMLRNLGFKQRAHTSFYYVPPVLNEKLISRLEFFNEMGKMFWPFPAGFYCLILQKYQQCPVGFVFQNDKELILEQKPTSTVPINRNWTNYRKDSFKNQ